FNKLLCSSCIHQMCVSECPSGFFRDDRKRCKKCSSVCETCVGSRSDQCITCRPGYHLIEGSNTCAANCADGFYLDSGTPLSSGLTNELARDGHKCQMTCNPGTYFNGHRRTCEPCHRACATCAGTGIEACIKCAEGYLLEDWRCVSTCSPGYYLSEQRSDVGEVQRTSNEESWAEGGFCVLVKKNNLCQRRVLQQLCCRTCSQKG
uniref:PLAC domain-containing protein n=1 Tax=Fundulus heteroclitus TaxID=8078 RepID=A0A3Q2UDZ3_FUNHE